LDLDDQDLREIAAAIVLTRAGRGPSFPRSDPRVAGIGS
jgi:hypothetical protein